MPTDTLVFVSKTMKKQLKIPNNPSILIIFHAIMKILTEIKLNYIETKIRGRLWKQLIMKVEH